MSSTSKRSWLKWLLIIMAVLVAHVALAPHTTRLQQDVSAKVASEWKAYQHQQFLKQLENSDGICRSDLVPCVLAFRDYLATRDIKLRVILRPGNQAIIGKDGKLLTTPSPTSHGLMGAESALRKAGIRTVNLLPGMYTDSVQHPDRSVLQADGAHFSEQLITTMTRMFCDSLEDWQKTRKGRQMLLVGDCYSYLMARELKKGDLLPGARSQWKNASDYQMAYEISQVPPELLPGVHELYWILSSDSVSPGIALPLPHPSPPDPTAVVNKEVRSVPIRITRSSRVPAGLGPNAPYPNALALHECTTEKGDKLLVVVPVLQDRKPQVATCWDAGQFLTLTIQSWDAAVQTTPNLAREQVFDDIQDFESERYYVTSWSVSP